MKFPKVFYGWWVVAAGSIIGLYVGGGIFYGFTAIFEPIVAELGWSYTQVSLAASLRGFEHGILAPLVGFLADRLGPRKLTFAGGIFGAAGLLLLSRTHSLSAFYLASCLLALGMSCCTSNVLMVPIANWFRRRIGTASGIMMAGYGIGGLLIPIIVWLTDEYGWREATLMLGFGLAAIVIPLSFLLRHHPEPYGYLPDGDTRQGDDTERRLSPPARQPIQFRKMLRERTFWFLSVVFLAHSVVLSTVVTHVMPCLTSVGINRAVSGIIATSIPVVSITGRLGMGFLSDRFSRRTVSAVILAMMGIGVALFALVSSDSMWILFPFLFFFSIGTGGANVARATLVRDYYGRVSYGTIFGLVSGLGMVGQIGGPVAGGWAYDQWANYQPVWVALSALSFLATLAVICLPRLEAKVRPAMQKAVE